MPARRRRHDDRAADPGADRRRRLTAWRASTPPTSQRTEGFVVVGQAQTAAEARDLAARCSPDLVLMDIYLPDGNGLDVVRSLLEKPHAPDVIVISAARELDAVRAAMQLGAVHYLVKPFGYQALAERLAAYQRLRHHIDRIDGTPNKPTSTSCSGCCAPRTSPPPGRRKGTRRSTLKLVRDAVRGQRGDVSAAEVSEQVGISRATAQRYLSYLERHGVVKLQLRYGTTGRPRHRYRMHIG